MTELQRFAKILNDEGDEQATYARNLARASGGNETDQSELAWLKASIFHEVAKAASKAAEQAKAGA